MPVQKALQIKLTDWYLLDTSERLNLELIDFFLKVVESFQVMFRSLEW